MHTGTAVTTIGANGHRADLFYVPYGIMERIQVTVFFVQELVLSGLYLWRSKSFLGLYRRRKARGGTVQRKKRSMVIHLILTNVIVVVRMYTHKILFPPPLFFFLLLLLVLSSRPPSDESFVRRNNPLQGLGARRGARSTGEATFLRFFYYEHINAHHSLLPI